MPKANDRRLLPLASPTSSAALTFGTDRAPALASVDGGKHRDQIASLHGDTTPTPQRTKDRKGAIRCGLISLYYAERGYEGLHLSAARESKEWNAISLIYDFVPKKRIRTASTRFVSIDRESLRS